MQASILVAGIVLLLTPSQPFAQSPGVITGVALALNDKPLPGTSIIVWVRASASAAASFRSTVTDRDGRFVITGLPIGSYTVVADLPGFALTGQRTVLTADRPDVTLTFLLTLEPAEEIIVSPRPFLRPL